MLRVLAAAAVLSFAVPGACASPAATGRLEGRATLAPIRPVCIAGRPCSGPAARTLLVFRRDEAVAARIRTDAEGRYAVRLPPGAYRLSAPAYRIGSGVTPRTVRVRPGATRRVDLVIDTGLQ